MWTLPPSQHFSKPVHRHSTFLRSYTKEGWWRCGSLQWQMIYNSSRTHMYIYIYFWLPRNYIKQSNTEPLGRSAGARPGKLHFPILAVSNFSTDYSVFNVAQIRILSQCLCFKVWVSIVKAHAMGKIKGKQTNKKKMGLQIVKREERWFYQ